MRIQRIIEPCRSSRREKWCTEPADVAIVELDSISVQRSRSRPNSEPKCTCKAARRHDGRSQPQLTRKSARRMWGR